ncbi:MAG TPA: trehalase family glycosidase [bacterium]|nr:trehalase family glycosidase [bacterium]
MRKIGVVLAVVFLAFGAGAREVSFAPGVSFEGSPSYVSEFATQFRDNGGPLSPYGSHFGLKAEVREKRFAGVEHYACATGKNILDYSRTGLAGRSWVSFDVGGREIGEAAERKVHFEYFGWEEEAKFEGFTAILRVQFLGLDQYLISVKVKNMGAAPLEIGPELNFKKSGKKMKILWSSRSSSMVFKFAVQPTITPGESYMAVISEADYGSISRRKGFKIRINPVRWEEGHPNTIYLAPGAEQWSWFIFGYSLDSADKALQSAREAQEKFSGPDDAWQKMLETRDRFFSSLPAPHLAAGQGDYLDLYRMAATALANQLYAPRVNMEHWACVPTKVHYNWFWLWDSGFQALGYSEFNAEAARDVILTQFQAQRRDGFISHMADEREKPLTPHSQPPVFGYSAGKFIPRYAADPAFKDFEKVMYEQSGPFLKWWDRTRDRNHNGLYEYLSQDEGGWDNSPRMDYVPGIMWISYVGSLGEVLGARFKPLDNTDANAWMYSYYRAMEQWAEDLGRPEEAGQWKQRAIALAHKVDEIMWDPEVGCWLDTYKWIGSKNYRHFRVLTPHIWFPAFTGATMDEQKAREVIEKHLLNPEEFFGKYPIPIVAYNDPKYDITKQGWTASIWLVTAYSALEALWRFGYEEEADELRARLLAMMADQDGMKGIYETYNPETGKYKDQYSTGGYASTQFGWSSAFTMEIILERYEEERFVFADTTRISGFIRRAEDFQTRDAFYRIEAGLDAPRVELASADGMPLLDSGSIRIKLSDPYDAIKQQSFRIVIRGRTFTVKMGEEKALDLN